MFAFSHFLQQIHAIEIRGLYTAKKNEQLAALSMKPELKNALQVHTLFNRKPLNQHDDKLNKI